MHLQRGCNPGVGARQRDGGAEGREGRREEGGEGGGDGGSAPLTWPKTELSMGCSWWKRGSASTDRSLPLDLVEYLLLDLDRGEAPSESFRDSLLDLCL